MNVGRLFISTAAGFLLPTFLIHKLPVATYSAWVLILQMGAYVGYLDFGIQSGIAKYVAEYEAKGDTAGASVRASAGLALLLSVSLIGVVLTLGLAWLVPKLFHDMPSALYPDVRMGLLFVGVSVSFALLCSIFASIFMGLQRYAVPTSLALINRLLYVGVVLGSVATHLSLGTMCCLVAVVNVTTGLLHFVAWRRFASQVKLSLYGLDWSVVREMIGFCSTLAVFAVAMLCISGMDVTIVGRYDFRQTAFYSIASTPTNFMIGIMGSALAPLLPSASALSVHRSSRQMGEMLARATRYATSLLVITGLPLLVAGYWVLRLWVGPAYSPQIVGYLRILVLANVLRNTCAPYASMLVATESQRIAIASATAEGLVNLSVTIYLAQRIGAIGVAYGTLLGAAVGVGMHFGLSMHYTYAKLSITRARLFLSGIGRPLLMVIPSVLTLPRWWRNGAAEFNTLLWIAWVLSTGILFWYAVLNPDERNAALRLTVGRLRTSNAPG
jgi:O-antigen/teichoic acid export membrane protein